MGWAQPPDPIPTSGAGGGRCTPAAYLNGVPTPDFLPLTEYCPCGWDGSCSSRPADLRTEASARVLNRRSPGGSGNAPDIFSLVRKEFRLRVVAEDTGNVATPPSKKPWPMGRLPRNETFSIAISGIPRYGPHDDGYLESLLEIVQSAPRVKLCLLLECVVSG